MRRSPLLWLTVLTLGSFGPASGQRPAGPYSILVGPGPEDFELQRNGPHGPRLIISSQDRRKHKKDAGQILFMDLEGDDREHAHPFRIEGRHRPLPLHPIGISLVEKPDQTLLYVVHSGEMEHWIEKYEVGSDHLVYVDRFEDQRITTPNDLVALPNGEIYVSNAGLSRNAFGNLFATLFHRPRGSVVHFDGRTWSDLLPHALFPNGLAIDPDGRYLFINLFGAKRMRIYDRSTSKFLRDVELKAHPDNLSWEIPGKRLNVACHRSQWRTGLHIVSARIHAPSVGFAIDTEAAIAGRPAVTPLYDLPSFDSSSTALAFGGRIYVSQMIEPFIVVLHDGRPKE